MSCSSLIRASESSFTLAQKIISTLSEKYKFNAEEAWNEVSSNSVVQLQKRFKKMKKANNPLSSIKKPRTSFSFFTKQQVFNKNNYNTRELMNRSSLHVFCQEI